MIQGIFRYRKSRRLAEVEVNDRIAEAYISNGAEIPFLCPGTHCILRAAENEARKTPFDLYAAYDQDTLVCIDTKAPLQVALKWYEKKMSEERPDETIRFVEDTRSSYFYGIPGATRLMVQVMGTSLSNNRIAYLPEIPSRTLSQKLEDLLQMKAQDWDCRLLVVICRDDTDTFSPNESADPYFAHLLEEVHNADIPIDCLRCTVSADGMLPERLIPLALS